MILIASSMIICLINLLYQFSWEPIDMQIVKNAFNKYVCIKPLIMMMIGFK